MLFNSEGLSLQVELIFENETIETVTEFKFLGITLDHGLLFENHYSILYKKLSQFYSIVRKLGQYLPKQCLRILYFAYYHSNLSYCISVWFPLLRKSLQNSIYITQKKIVRGIVGANYTQQIYLIRMAHVIKLGAWAHEWKLTKVRNIIIVSYVNPLPAGMLLIMY